MFDAAQATFPRPPTFLRERIREKGRERDKSFSEAPRNIRPRDRKWKINKILFCSKGVQSGFYEHRKSVAAIERWRTGFSADMPRVGSSA